ncbi:hypothetical protein ABIB06_005443 [Bradyrhizobium sp. LB8.2]
MDVEFLMNDDHAAAGVARPAPQAKVSELPKAAAKIGELVELINPITGQTNLLVQREH